MEAPAKFYSLLMRKNILSKVMDKFESLPDTPSKVKYIQILVRKYDLVPKVQKPNPKNDAVSKLYRAEATNLYRKKTYVEALVELNKDICYADDAESL
jgi:hypothetical protein